jgi:hypothetical protein
MYPAREDLKIRNVRYIQSQIGLSNILFCMKLPQSEIGCMCRDGSAEPGEEFVRANKCYASGVKS